LAQCSTTVCDCVVAEVCTYMWRVVFVPFAVSLPAPLQQHKLGLMLLCGRQSWKTSGKYGENYNGETTFSRAGINR